VFCAAVPQPEQALTSACAAAFCKRTFIFGCAAGVNGIQGSEKGLFLPGNCYLSVDCLILAGLWRSLSCRWRGEAESPLLPPVAVRTKQSTFRVFPE